MFSPSCLSHFLSNREDIKAEAAAKSKGLCAIITRVINAVYGKRNMLSGIGGQIGGPKAALAVETHWLDLNRLLKKHCSKQYATEIDEFAPLLRVDGEIVEWDWNKEGCNRLRLARKQRYITADIGVLRKHWENQPPSLIRQYLIENLEGCLKLMVARLKKIR